jgi:hypothetical protein
MRLARRLPVDLVDRQGRLHLLVGLEFLHEPSPISCFSPHLTAIQTGSMGTDLRTPPESQSILLHSVNLGGALINDEVDVMFYPGNVIHPGRLLLGWGTTVVSVSDGVEQGKRQPAKVQGGEDTTMAVDKRSSSQSMPYLLSSL